MGCKSTFFGVWVAGVRVSAKGRGGGVVPTGLILLLQVTPALPIPQCHFLDLNWLRPHPCLTAVNVGLHLSPPGPLPGSTMSPSATRVTAGAKISYQDAVADFTAAGSSLKFCLIAEGAADIYPRFGRTMEWDTGAGQAVLEAAGGTGPASGPR